MGRLSGQERLEKVRDYVLSAGTVRNEDLASEFHVSLMTVHRDLDRLAAEGWLRRVHGGATVERSVLFESNVKFRSLENAEAKAKIARAAADLVQPGQAVLLDDSTTALAVARELVLRGDPWTAITNANQVVNLVAAQSNADLIALGGVYYPSADAFFGAGTVAALSNLYADIAMMSTSAITAGDCYHQLQDSIAIKRAMLASAERAVMLADFTKLSKHALHKFATLAEFATVVVDDAASSEQISELGEYLADVRVAGTVG
ncbi:MAG: DeoR/GlpR family DNA-binding transcription regulator [Bifidobacteriaceae bacterium]|jgi:DeoR/GlpR family transcriptional regulator of sugar metabolism|nr:DeoR/GlpR family DNA-binding transcription regulator [Bifidobacteriaceae bacterium]